MQIELIRSFPAKNNKISMKKKSVPNSKVLINTYVTRIREEHQLEQVRISLNKMYEILDVTSDNR